MKNNIKIFTIILLIIIAIGAVYYLGFKQSDSIRGCYVAHLAKDVFTLEVQTQQGENVSGILDINNYEKDSSSGTFNGTYKDGILFGEYSFRSEGMDSVSQIIFKKEGNGFLRGYGKVDDLTGTTFTSLKDVQFDSSYIYNLVSATCTNLKK